MTDTDPGDDPAEDSSLTRSFAVDAVAEAIQTAVVRYVLRRGRSTLPPSWQALDDDGRNRLRAAVVALATLDRPSLTKLLDLVHE